MGNVNLMAEFFLICLSIGTIPFTILADSAKTGGGVLKIVNGLSLVLLLVAFGIHLSYSPFRSEVSIAFVTGIISMLISLFYYQNREVRSPITWIAWGMSLVSLIIFAKFYIESYWLASFFFLSACAFVGIVNYSLYLGHWYLVTPKLSTLPLERACKIMWWIIAIKFFFSLWGVFENEDFYTKLINLAPGYSFNFMIILIRFIVGYGGMLLCSILAYKLVKLRDTQGATGIFYAMAILIFIAEISSTYLYFNFGLLI